MPPELRDDGAVDGAFLPVGLFLDVGSASVDIDAPGDVVSFTLSFEPADFWIGVPGDTISLEVLLESGFAEGLILSSSPYRGTEEDDLIRINEETGEDERILEGHYHLAASGDTELFYALALDLEGTVETEISPIVDGASLGFLLDISESGEVSAGVGLPGEEFIVYTILDDGFYAADANVDGEDLPALAFSLEPGAAAGEIHVTVDGGDVLFIFSLVSGSASGEIRLDGIVDGIAFPAIEISLEPGFAAQIDDGTAFGSTFVVSVHVQPGSGAAYGYADGDRPEVYIVLLAGATDGAISTAPVRFQLRVSVQPGTVNAEREANAEGADVSFALVLVPGHATAVGRVMVPGATLHFAMVAQPGSAYGLSGALGAAVFMSYRLVSGKADAPVYALGDTLSLSYALEIGTGGVGVPGFTGHITVDLWPGVVTATGYYRIAEDGRDRIAEDGELRITESPLAGAVAGVRLLMPLAVQSGHAGGGLTVDGDDLPLSFYIFAGLVGAGITLPAASLSITLSVQPGHADGAKSVVIDGATVAFNFAVEPGAAQGEVGAGFASLRIVYQVQAVAPAGAAEVDGALFVFGYALAPGYATGIERGVAHGATLKFSVVLQPGGAYAGEGVVVGAAVLPLLVSLAAGDADAIQNPIAAGKTMSVALSLVAGLALGDYAHGANLVLPYAFQPGRATGRSAMARGSTLRFDFGLHPGSTLGGVSVGGDTLIVSYQGSWPGYPHGDANVDGADLSYGLVLSLSGSAVGIDRGLAIGAVLPMLVAVQAGSAVGGQGVIVGAAMLPVALALSAGGVDGIQNPVVGAVTFTLALSLSAGEALGDYAPGATLVLPYVFVPGRATGRSAMARGSTLRFNFGLQPGSTLGGVSVGGEILHLSYAGSWPGYPHGDANVDGVALTFAFDISPGSAVGIDRGLAIGATLPLLVVVEAGSAVGGEGVTVGAISFPVQFSLQVGDVDGVQIPVVDGVELSLIFALEGGEAFGEMAQGAALSLAYLLASGQAIGADVVAIGAALRFSFAVLPGTVYGGEGVTVGAITFSVQFSLQAGSADAIRNPVVDGAALAFTLVLEAGEALGDYAPGSTLVLPYVLLPGRATGRAGLAVGATLRFTFRLLPGATDGSISVGGDTLVVSYQGSWPGYPSGEANVDGVELLFVFDIWPGFAFGVDRGLALGSTLPLFLAVEPGDAVGGEGVIVGDETLPIGLLLQAGDAEAIENPVCDGALLSLTFVLSAGEALGDYAPGALLILAYVLQPGFAAGKDAVAVGSTLRFSFVLRPGATEGGISVGGDTLVVSYEGSWPGYPSGEANVDGVGFVLALDLLPGSADGVTSVVVDGDTLLFSLAVEGGSAEGGYGVTLDGATFALELDLLSGTAEGDLSDTAPGDTLVLSVAIAPGYVEGSDSASVPGADYIIALSLEPGVAAGTANAVGDVLPLLLSILVPPVVVTADGIANGDTRTILYEFLPGIGSIISFIKIVGLIGSLPDPIHLWGYRDEVDMDGSLSETDLMGNQTGVSLGGRRDPTRLRGDMGAA